MNNDTNPLHNDAFLAALLDIIIPPSADGVMPGAGSIGIGDAVVAAIDADERSGPAVVTALIAIAAAATSKVPAGLPALSPAERLEVVQSVLPDHPSLIVSVLRHLYPAYYQHPRVLEAIGEPARPPFPLGFEIEPTDERLLAILHARRK